MHRFISLRNDQDPQPWMIGQEAFNELHSILAAQAQVEQYEVGPATSCHFERQLTRVSFAATDEMRLSINEPPQPVAIKRVVVHDEYAMLGRTRERRGHR